ncbi:MAG: metallophosphoesterase family protein, partial [Parvularculaceae bacterium]
ATTPEGLRLYAIGDIHGCADHLDSLLDKIAAEERASGPAQLIFLGDYVDRGPDSRGVIDRLLEIRRSRPQTIFLKGNHEAVFLDFLADPYEARDWLDWGGADTLASYGVEGAARAPDDLADEMKSRLPADHLGFLEGLELMRAFGDYLFVHAGVRPGVPLAKQEERDLLWIRGEFHNAPPELRPDKIVVHGHHPMRKPLDAGWRIAVDTGACFGGKLTAVVLEGVSRRFLSS